LETHPIPPGLYREEIETISKCARRRSKVEEPLEGITEQRNKEKSQRKEKKEKLIKKNIEKSG